MQAPGLGIEWRSCMGCNWHLAVFPHGCIKQATRSLIDKCAAVSDGGIRNGLLTRAISAHVELA